MRENNEHVQSWIFVFQKGKEVKEAIYIDLDVKVKLRKEKGEGEE